MPELDPLFQVELEEHSHAPKRGHFLVIEACYPAGSEVQVEGGLRCLAADDQEAKAFAFWAGQALAANRELGGMTSVGYGECLKVRTSVEAPPAPAPLDLGQGNSHTLQLRLDRPFCFPSLVRPSDNRFESREFIPGSALKAVFASRLLQTDPGRKDTALWSTFDALTVRHVLPTPEDAPAPRRPRAVPLSWVYQKPRNDIGNCFLDLARVNDPDSLATGETFVNATNWKQKVRDWAKDLSGQPRHLHRTLRLHPAIDPERLTVQEGALHTQDCVVPGDHLWTTELVLPEDAKPDEMYKLRDALGKILAEELGPLGQTDAFATVQPVDTRAGVADHPDDCFTDGLAVVVLQSEALLLTEPWEFPPTGGEAEYLKALQEAWTDFSEGSLHLVRHFSALRGMGGKYLQGQFWDKVSPGSYRPVLLCTEGSTFVLKPAQGQEKEANACLKKWLKEGLPQRKGARGGNDWKSNPFLSANGYGEISLNFEHAEVAAHA